MAVGQPGDTARVGLEGPCEDEGKHWVGGTVLQHQMMEQLKETSPRHRSCHQEKQRSTQSYRSCRRPPAAREGCTLPQPAHPDLPSAGHSPANRSSTAAKICVNLMFRTCFHPHLAEEDPSSVDTGGSQDQCHHG